MLICYHVLRICKKCKNIFQGVCENFAQTKQENVQNRKEVMKMHMNMVFHMPLIFSYNNWL